MPRKESLGQKRLLSRYSRPTAHKIKMISVPMAMWSAMFMAPSPRWPSQSYFPNCDGTSTQQQGRPYLSVRSTRTVGLHHAVGSFALPILPIKSTNFLLNDDAVCCTAYVAVLAHSGHSAMSGRCPPSGVKQTWAERLVCLAACQLGCERIVSKRLGSPYRSGRSPHCVKVKNPKAPAVNREAEEDWGR
jgi:hypothetical protein